MGTSITIYSQNVSCDIHSEKLVKNHGEEYKFQKRFIKLLDNLPEKIDVIAFNEIRHARNVSYVVEKLTDKGFDAKSFANNQDAMSFNNILAVNKSCKWKIERWECLWVALNNLQDTHCKMEGDPYGRCVAVVYLKQAKSEKRVCVLSSHVMPFGEVKRNQQNALFTINKKNSSLKPKIPTFIVGDLNRFDDEDEDFQSRLEECMLKEAHLEQLTISNNEEIIITDKKDIGTFMPWPTDVKIYEDRKRMPMSRSRLDVQLYSSKLVKIKRVIARASMLFEPNTDKPPEGIDTIRHLLDLKMTSDHIAIIGTYEIK